MALVLPQASATILKLVVVCGFDELAAQSSRVKDKDQDGNAKSFTGARAFVTLI
jgi:hypothetical protein